MTLSPGVKRILERIVNEMDGCSGGKCDDHAIRFSRADVNAAKYMLSVQKKS